jgi:hypothetical protein
MSQSQNRIYNGPTYSGRIDISPTTALYNLPTVNVLQSGKLNLPPGTRCVNVIGNFNIVLQSASLVNGQELFTVATGGVPANLSLDNGGQIGGLATYYLTPGDFLLVVFDGTNLNALSHTGYQF